MNEEEPEKIIRAANVIEIPIEFYDDFKEEPVGAWQSYGKYPQESEFPYFENRQAVHAMVDKNRPNPINDRLEFHPEFWCRDDNYRFIHTDIGWTHDAAALSMCHVSDWVRTKVRKEDEEGEYYYATEFRPEFTVDFMLQIKPPPGGEIDFSDIRKVIYEVYQRGFPILMITFDRYQSVDMMQILRRGTETCPGFTCAHLSLDRTTNYPVIDLKKPDGYKKVPTGSGKFANLSVWSHGKTTVNSSRLHLPFYKPQTDTSVVDLVGNTRNVDDYGVTLAETEYITLVEQEAHGATFDPKALKVKESPKGSIDLLESVLGSIFNASNNVTDMEEVETDQERRMRIARQASQARTEFDRRDARQELYEEEGIPENEQNPEDHSIFDEGDNIDGAKLY